MRGHLRSSQHARNPPPPDKSLIAVAGGLLLNGEH